MITLGRSGLEGGPQSRLFKSFSIGSSVPAFLRWDWSFQIPVFDASATDLTRPITLSCTLSERKRMNPGVSWCTFTLGNLVNPSSSIITYSRRGIIYGLPEYTEEFFRGWRFQLLLHTPCTFPRLGLPVGLHNLLHLDRSSLLLNRHGHLVLFYRP